MREYSIECLHNQRGCYNDHALLTVYRRDRLLLIYARTLDMVSSGGLYYVRGIADPGTGTGGTLFFSMDELRTVVNTESIIGVRVWLEHGSPTEENIGTVVHARLDSVSGMHVIMAFETQKLTSLVVREWIKNGLFKGISLGYNAELDTRMDVRKKYISEVSIVHEPHHPTCMVYEVTDTLPEELCGTSSSMVPCAAASRHGATLELNESRRSAGQVVLLASACWETVFASLAQVPENTENRRIVSISCV